MCSHYDLDAKFFDENAEDSVQSVEEVAETIQDESKLNELEESVK